jgi:hypothetical protein
MQQLWVFFLLSVLVSPFFSVFTAKSLPKIRRTIKIRRIPRVNSGPSQNPPDQLGTMVYTMVYTMVFTIVATRLNSLKRPLMATGIILTETSLRPLFKSAFTCTVFWRIPQFYFYVVTRGQKNCVWKTRFETTDRQVKFYIYGQFYKHASRRGNTRFNVNNFL